VNSFASAAVALDPAAFSSDRPIPGPVQVWCDRDPPDQQHPVRIPGADRSDQAAVQARHPPRSLLQLDAQLVQGLHQRGHVGAVDGRFGDERGTLDREHFSGILG
jgi:hypothetical protein